ncbi:MAG TPA: LEA type 2 family protein [Gemmatimonadales bacterium]|jgi:hypothetical protein|nr:LEA type 2 family protein [Gemmatimonadales bacterium]
MPARRSLSPTAASAGLASVLAGLLACTPLGGWLYSDPTFALSGVRTRYRGSPADTLQLVLTGCNLNDFNVNGLTVEGRLLVDGDPVGSLWSAQPFTLKMRDSVEVLVPLEIPRADEPRVHAKGDDQMTARYELNGRVEVNTPIGIRRVPLQQYGEVRFDAAGVASGWTVRNAKPCKPGQSVIPGQAVTPRVLVDTMFRPVTPVGVPAGRPDM